MARADHLISVQNDSISPSDPILDRVAHLENVARAVCRRFQRPIRALFLPLPYELPGERCEIF